ncbi:uncharacterized protein PAC_11697 [Phialocephala subalpina]|uniref:Wax synthase domain-containing protein n=1 Tax=Phialocephala subalpina TaxID=576137 RepID=A0A1L7X9U9_9HELO|nr:uncharacterized protein PAC_11697 [Phialocephala subalpina]
MFEALFPAEGSPPPSWLQTMMSLVSVGSILLPYGVARLSAGGIVLGLFFYLQFWTADNTVGAYAAGTGCASVLLRWIDLLAVHRPETDFWPVKKVENDTSHVPVEERVPSRIWAKLKWFSSLWIASRGIGWNIQVNQLPPAVPSDYPKALWLRQVTIRTFFMYVGYDMTSNILLYFTRLGPFFTQPLVWQVFYAWVKAFRAYYSFELSYFALAIASVAIGLSQPYQWPPITGSFRRDAYTVRRMWGRCWHQCMRRSCSEAGRIVKNTLGLPDGSFRSKYSQIWIGFLVSALSHHAGATVGCFEDGGYWQFVYFMIQPAGIMLEDLAIHVGKIYGLKWSNWMNRLGVLWTILWFSWTLRFMVAYQPSIWVTSYSIPSAFRYAEQRFRSYLGLEVL